MSGFASSATVLVLTSDLSYPGRNFCRWEELYPYVGRIFQIKGRILYQEIHDSKLIHVQLRKFKMCRESMKKSTQV
jgi:hypothetical protein